MVVATGIDLIEIGRVKESISRHGYRFLNRIYTPSELVEARENPASLAAGFAAKEAVGKALGTGIGPISWQEVEILHGPSRQPELHLHGFAQKIALQQNLTTWSISLSHTQTHAIAVVIAVGN